MPDAESPPLPVSLTVEQTFQQAISHHQLGRVQEAERLYRTVLQAEPRHPDANHNLGVLAVQIKQSAAALPYFEVALKANPYQGQYWLSYIDALIQADQIDVARQALAQSRQLGLKGEAVEALATRLEDTAQFALQSNSPSPQEIETLVALFTEKRYTEAVTLAQTMTVRYPLHGFGWKVLGVMYRNMGRSADALAPMHKAATLSPNEAELHNDLGNVLRDLGRPGEAEASYGRALKIKPDFAEAHSNLGNVLRDLGRLGEAEASYRRALEIKPDFAEAYSNLGNTLRELGRLGEAEASYRRALEIKPDFAEAHSNLGSTIRELGRLHEAEASFRRALQIRPDLVVTHSNLLFCLSHDPGASPQEVYAEHCAFGDLFEAPLRSQWPAHRNLPDPARRLRVGFVSADLRNHAVSSFVEPLWAALDPKQVEIWAYANHRLEDEVTLRLKGMARQWRKVLGMSDEDLAGQIRQDEIDILFDLSGHTGGNRLLTFARKPAPIQVSWIGNPNTTGLRAMDYYLADRFSAPPGLLDPLFTEKIVRLPSGALFQPLQQAPAVNGLPALESGVLTFGSFNRNEKVVAPVVALWSRVLNAVPGSRMLLGGLPDASQKERLAEQFARHGVDRQRLIFHSRVGMTEYLTLHHQIDLILDTYPYSGGTTTYHAAWMGVPVLTLAGKTMASRVGLIINANIGLQEFIAESEDAFVAQAVRCSQQLPELAALRAGLRARLLASPSCQAQMVARWLELALRTMWHGWCEKRPAASFGVDS